MNTLQSLYHFGFSLTVLTLRCDDFGDSTALNSLGLYLFLLVFSLVWARRGPKISEIPASNLHFYSFDAKSRQV